MTPGHRLLPVKLEVFEGPLDLLLHLIERNELDISAVSLVLVVDQYMQYLELMRSELKLEGAADFMVVAGRLLLIKSRSLLPRVEAPPEAAEEEDVAEQLARQLEEYREFKRIAAELQALKETRGPTFHRASPAPDVPPSVKLTGLDIDRLVAAFQKTLERAIEQLPSDIDVGPRRLTQADRVAAIENGLAGSRTLNFEALLEDCQVVEDVIVTFLAVLELLKQRRLRVWQGSAFGTIILSRAHG